MEECAGNRGKAVHAVERRQPSAKEQVLLPEKLLTVGLWDWGPDGARGAPGGGCTTELFPETVVPRAPSHTHWVRFPWPYLHLSEEGPAGGPLTPW